MLRVSIKPFRLAPIRVATVGAVAVLLFLAAAPVSADAWVVHLKNGNTFISKYRPVQASYDEEKLLIMTDVGNIIALHREDIEEVINDTENRGFGTVINTTTIDLGFLNTRSTTLDDLEAAQEAAADAAANQPVFQQFPTRAPVTNSLVAEPNSGFGIPVGLVSGVPPL